MCRFLKVFALLLLFFSCKDLETYNDSSDEEVIIAFDKAKQSSIQRDINYFPKWQERIEFEGAYYIPLNTDKRLYAYTPDRLKYLLDGKIWLKASKKEQDWRFTLLTVLPNDIYHSKQSGLFVYEDWKTGELSYERYIHDKLFQPRVYSRNVKMTKYGKKATNEHEMPCQTVTYEVCAGAGGPYESCTTKT